MAVLQDPIEMGLGAGGDVTTDEPDTSRIGRRNQIRLAVAGLAIAAWFLFEFTSLFATPTERYIDRIYDSRDCSTVASNRSEALRDRSIMEDWDDIRTAAWARSGELGCLGLEL